MKLTPFQPVGPYFHVMLRDEPPGRARLAGDATAGRRIVLEGRVLDGARSPVPDALVEIWHADADGRYGAAAAGAPRQVTDAEDGGGHGRAAAPDPFCGYGRVATEVEGRFRFDTIKPGAAHGLDGRLQSPHVLVAVFAPGILTRYWTRAYFDDEPGNATDTVLQLVPARRRSTLVAQAAAGRRYTFDIVLQGEHETVFFEA